MKLFKKTFKIIFTTFLIYTSISMVNATEIATIEDVKNDMKMTQQGVVKTKTIKNDDGTITKIENVNKDEFGYTISICFNDMSIEKEVLEVCLKHMLYMVNKDFTIGNGLQLKNSTIKNIKVFEDAQNKKYYLYFDFITLKSFDKILNDYFEKYLKNKETFSNLIKKITSEKGNYLKNSEEIIEKEIKKLELEKQKYDLNDDFIVNNNIFDNDFFDLNFNNIFKMPNFGMNLFNNETKDMKEFKEFKKRKIDEKINKLQDLNKEKINNLILNLPEKTLDIKSSQTNQHIFSSFKSNDNSINSSYINISRN